MAAAAGAVGLTAMVIRFHGRWPALTAAWVVYLLILAPSSGLVRTGPSVTADRYGYVSMLPLFALLAGALAERLDLPGDVALHRVVLAVLLLRLAWTVAEVVLAGIVYWLPAGRARSPAIGEDRAPAA